MTLEIPRIVETFSIGEFAKLGVLNPAGKPRLKLAQDYFSHGNIDLEVLTDLYRYWRDLDEFGVIRKTEIDPRDYSIKHEYKAIKSSKRGNDVYRWKIKRRLGWMDKIPNLEFFSDEDVENGSAYTRMLFFTLTYDTNRCDRISAWENVGLEYNRWITRVRSKYGKVSVFRVWQTMGNGYPHVHGVMLFEDPKKGSFKVFKHEDVDGKISFRVEEKGDLETSWHSFVDVVAVRSVKGALRYCKRYMTRENMESSESSAAQPIYANGSVKDRDMALMWLYRKRSFAVSEEFRKALHDLIALRSNSKGKGMAQTLFDGSMAPKREVWYEWIGSFSKSELGIDEDPPWRFNLERVSECVRARELWFDEKSSRNSRSKGRLNLERLLEYENRPFEKPRDSEVGF